MRLAKEVEEGRPARPAPPGKKQCILAAMRTRFFLSLATLIALAPGCGSSEPSAEVTPPVAVDPLVAPSLPPRMVAPPATPQARPPQAHPEGASTPITAPSEGTCGGLADAPRTQTFFLRQRVGITIPTADIHAARHSLMAAPPSRDWREVGWAEHGEARMAVAASESRARVDGSLIDAVRPWTHPGWSVESINENAVVAFPPALVAEGTDARLATIYLRDAAHLLLTLDLVTDPENAARGGCLAFARDIARSAVVGTRALEVAARVARFQRYEIDVPEGYASTIDDGPDFAVFRIERIQQDGTAPEAGLGIYSGDHASFHGTGNPALTRTLLGSEVGFFDTSEARHHQRDALIQVEGGVVHLFYGSMDPVAFEALDQAAMSLRVGS